MPGAPQVDVTSSTAQFGLSAVLLGICAPADAQLYEVEYGVGHRDDYVVVERSGTIIIEEPAPRVVIVHAPPPPPGRVVVRPELPCVGAIWVEGYWRYTGVRFAWVRGHWIPPRDGYRFVPPRWRVHAGYHYYTPGYFRPYHVKVRRFEQLETERGASSRYRPTTMSLA